MADYILRDGELEHHGILGMKWGVRRYQTKNGTLTAAGKKRYERELEKAKNEARILRNRQATENKFKKLDEMKAKNKAKKNALDGKVESQDVSKKPATGGEKRTTTKKTMNQMTNDEIRAKIERIELENRLKSLTPEKVSKGKQFADAFGGVVKTAATNILTDTGKAAVNKWLGLDDSDFKKLEKQSKIADFKKKIADSEMQQRKNRKEKEADAQAAAQKEKKTGNDEPAAQKAKKANTDRNNDTPPPKDPEVTVQGTGTSKRTEKRGPVYDVDIPVSSYPKERLALGQRTVAGLLEAPKKRDD